MEDTCNGLTSNHEWMTTFIPTKCGSLSRKSKLAGKTYQELKIKENRSDQEAIPTA